MHSETLRETLAALSEVAEKAAETLIRREAEHRAMLRRAVESGDFTLSIASERALDDARREHDRAVTARDMARQLLAEAVKRERQAERDAAKAEIEAVLADMTEEARAIDTEVAKLIGRILRLHGREVALHAKAKQFLRSPWIAASIVSAARSIATTLATLANQGGGAVPATKPWVAEAVASGAHSIRATYDAD